jgi:hypothetical protein
MSKEQGFTNLDARWLVELAKRDIIDGQTAVKLLAIARNIQKMDEKLAKLEGERNV